MTGWAIAISAGLLLVAATTGVFALRWHRRNLARLRLGYGWTKLTQRGIRPDPTTGVDEVYAFEIVLRNLSRTAIKESEFSGKPIVVRLNAPVVDVSGIVSRPKERKRPKVPEAKGDRILIEPFAFCLRQEVRIPVVTAEPPKGIFVEADAPEVIVERMRWRRF